MIFHFEDSGELVTEVKGFYIYSRESYGFSYQLNLVHKPLTEKFLLFVVKKVFDRTCVETKIDMRSPFSSK